MVAVHARPGEGFRQVDLGQAGTAFKGSVINPTYTVRYVEFRQAGAVFKRHGPQLCNAVRNRYCFQADTIAERVMAKLRDRIGEFRGEKTGAVGKSAASNAGNAIGNGDLFKRGAIEEGQIPNPYDRVWYVCSAEFIAGIKGVIPDAAQPVRKSDSFYFAPKIELGCSAGRKRIIVAHLPVALDCEDAGDLIKTPGEIVAAGLDGRCLWLGLFRLVVYVFQRGFKGR